jgi:ABC-2 type transport system ATP-binding protein
MIEVEGLTQHYGVRPVLKNVSMRVSRGGIAAIIGPNGMGKSTLLSAVAGVLTPQQGRIRINGLERKSSPENELAIRRQTVYLPDRPWLPSSLTGREFLLGVAAAYEIPAARRFDHIERLLVLFDLAEIADSNLKSYSSGQQKKIGLSAAFLTESPVMLLDEPFSGGLDPSGILALKALLSRLTREQGFTVLMTTPVPELAEDCANQFVILAGGLVAADGTLEQIGAVAGCDGSLAEVLQRLISPQTLRHLDEYFEARK